MDQETPPAEPLSSRRNRPATLSSTPPSAPPAPARWRGSRPRGAPSRPAIPIVDAEHRIVGWTLSPPRVEEGGLRHPGAERLLGGRIFCTQVSLTRGEDIRRAGGPAAWTGPWRCLALCRVEHARGFAQRMQERVPAAPDPPQKR